jgi:hypothetical protein
MDKNSVLLISCSIGYGHQAAALNVEQRLRKQNPNVNILTLDTREYLSPLASVVSNQWDVQIRKGNLMVSQIVQGQGFYETVYGLFFNKRLRQKIQSLFQQHAITAIYDTQPLFTPILYKLFSQQVQAQPMTYHKIFTDLPTPRNASFFGGIKRSRLNDQLSFKIHAPAPLLAPEQNQESFWQKHCGLSATQIETSFALPVHESYIQPPADPNALHITLAPEYASVLPLPENAYVTTLMLGSQGVNAIYDYAIHYLAQLKNKSPSQPHYFFIACSKNQALYEELQELLARVPSPSPHRIIPLTMQTMDSLASLMWRSNQIIIRSGGISSLEQLALAQARKNNRATLWIHSSYKGSDPKALLKHTYAWERGNAEYLMKHLGARMTAPQLIDFFK